jgi:alpha-D-xyloside xylohydrolase
LETLWIEPWGPDAVRVRISHQPLTEDLPGALLEPQETQAEIRLEEDSACILNGRMQAEVAWDGHLRFCDAVTGEVLLEEPARWPFQPSREFRPLDGGLFRLRMEFQAEDDESFYGLGQHTHGKWDQKGCSMDLFHHNTEFSIPLAISSRNYAFLWNHPGTGQVDLAANRTVWNADQARQMDFWIVAGQSPADLLGRYTQATGKSPALPDWALGFWQSKLRYKTQEELLEVAREYHRRELPIDAIVLDYFHWPAMGEWKLDPQAFPDPEAMVEELTDMGIELVVSIWPMVNAFAETFAEMTERNLLLFDARGPAWQRQLPDHKPGMDKGPAPTYFYDPMNPEAREYIWQRSKEGYYKYGIKAWWLDGNEPELKHMDFDCFRTHLGSGREVVGLYPNLHAKAYFDGMKAEGEEHVVLLCRSGWAGIQRYGAILWSGDIRASFDILRRQVTAGLNVSMSGVPYWNTDIGGFAGAAKKHEDPAYRELLIRWFQYGAFCPVMRLHGNRDPNEVWSYGQEACEIFESYLHIRRRLRPYLQSQMQKACERGLPIMRPLLLEFPDDPKTWPVHDSYLLGTDLLVAPVLEAGARTRAVYLPAGATWTDAWTGEQYSGGQEIQAPTPIQRIPLYLRDGARLPICS